ncbi:TetR/AcrR family transcriptional regulator [Spirillospora sp. CA-294931]|uniref:TetR/AcrR family transcriptional regulator n=1 Tax=Spirillospora sp. CA-294931 TaxID=3240042 RepID=UPI003D91B555
MTRQTVVAAARRVAEAEGIDGLTIRRVATELGSTPMALYRHVKDKRELVLALLDDVAEGLPAPPEDGEPAERIVAMFASVDAYLADHLWVVDILRQGEYFAPRAGALFVWALDRFAELGLDDAAGAEAYRSMWWFVLGHLSYLPSLEPERRASQADLMVITAERTGTDPARLLRLMHGFDHRRAFEAGLRALVDALTAR